MTIALLTSALSNGLLDVGKKLFDDSVVDPALQPLKERFSRLVKQLYRAPEDKALHQAIQTALAKLGATVEGEGDPLQRWLKGKSLDRLATQGNDALRRCLARAIVEFVDPNADPPDDLLKALGWPHSERQQLAQLLGALRWELTQLDEWQPLINYADALAAKQQLQQMVARLARLDKIFVETPAGEALRVALIAQQLSQEAAAKIEEGYRQELIAELRFHDFRGIYQMRQDIRLPLADIYTELGLLPVGSDEQRQRAHEAILELRELERQAAEERRHHERISDAIAAAQRLVILGEPGAGKTMSLRFICLLLAYGLGAERFDLPAPYIPLFVRLADFARAVEQDAGLALDHFLLEYVSKRYSAPGLADFLRSALDNGACLALFDGMDEVGDDPVKGLSLRTRVVRAVQTFADRWCNETRHNRMIVTSRIEGYWSEALRSCQHVQLSPLRPPEEVAAFLQRWFVAHEQSHQQIHNVTPSLDKIEAIAKTNTQQMLNEIMSSASVRRLATNPLLLTILALIHENLGRLPNRRAKLYDTCIRTLVESWRQAQTELRSPVLNELGEETILRILAPMAYWLHEDRPGGTATFDEWRRKLCQLIQQDVTDDASKAEQIAQRFLHHARQEAGLLAERGLGQYGFFHLTFEEALAARQIARQSEQKRRQMVRDHWEDPRWHEVLLLAVGHLGLVMENSDGASELLLDLLKLEPVEVDNRGRQVVLAGRALADVGEQNVPPFVRTTVKRNLRYTMQDVNAESEQPNQPPLVAPPVRYAAGEVLDELGWLPDDLHRWQRCAKCADGAGRKHGDLLVMRYPVTNAHFAHFVASDGYSNPAYWGGEASPAWQWRLTEHSEYRGVNPINEPEYWRDARFGAERHGYPVVGVSWYEATAFAAWLTALLARGRDNATTLPGPQQVWLADLLQAGVSVVRLPTESEWVRLAGGDKPAGRYPWDGARQATTASAAILARANTNEAQLNGTSPVAMYPLGVSQPYMLCDMAGNVWEWTDSWYDESESGRVLRGGAWDDGRDLARCAVRDDLGPNHSYYVIGFRLVSPIDPGS